MAHHTVASSQEQQIYNILNIFVYFPLSSQRRLISHKKGSVSFFRPKSPLSVYPLWILQSDDAPWRWLAAVLLSSLFRVLLSVMQHPTWVQVHQFVFMRLTQAGPFPLFALSQRLWPLLLHHSMTDLGLPCSVLLHPFDFGPSNWFILWPGLCIAGVLFLFISYTTHYSY